MNLFPLLLALGTGGGLAMAEPLNPLTITPAVSGQFQLGWRANNLRPYQVECSPDLLTWEEFGTVVLGNGSNQSLTVDPIGPSRFFRLREGAVRPGFDEFKLPANDDGSTEEVSLGFSIKIFPALNGPTLWTRCFVNNNGNITIGTPASAFTPIPLQSSVQKIPGLIGLIAPFWADVDTRSAPEIHSGAREVTYGYGTVNGHLAFGVNWFDVGYFSNEIDKLNRFQLVLIDRSDHALSGNFDIEFNYNQVIWETGSYPDGGGKNGYGGYPARCGITNGIDSTIELTHSGETIVQLDENPGSGQPNYSTGLIYRSRSSILPGRFVFQVRDGVVLGALEVNAGLDVVLGQEEISTVLSGTAIDPSGGALRVKWSVLIGSSRVLLSDPNILNPTVTIPVGEKATLQLTATSTSDSNIGAADVMEIKR